jgi:hypothetical protein
MAQLMERGLAGESEVLRGNLPNLICHMMTWIPTRVADVESRLAQFGDVKGNRQNFPSV